MTYKSTSEAIKAHDDKRLFYLHPLVPEETSRSVFVTQEVRDIIEPPFPENRDGMAYAELRQILDAFSLGYEIRVGTNPFTKGGDADLARVDPVERQVWDFRTLEDRPYIRAFGCFAGRDLFIVLTWQWRDGLCWGEEVDRCRGEWASLFGELSPYSGKNLDDYLSFGYVEV